MIIGLDVQKSMANMTEMEEDSSVKGNYEIVNIVEAWKAFVKSGSNTKPEIALERSTYGKYVARLQRNRGLTVRLAYSVKLVLKFNTPKINDKEDSYKLSKLLMLGELPEINLLSMEPDDLKSLVRYRKSLAGDDYGKGQNLCHSRCAWDSRRCNRSVALKLRTLNATLRIYTFPMRWRLPLI